ncbi:glycosyltransferase family 39 protein [Candidatus Sumerlaeota bacterium]|nr:glycosyltransferase family 39 protein [Candidatus Sumerlaeota bacterium]
MPVAQAADRFPWLSAFAITGAALAFRLCQLSEEALFIDEYLTIRIAQVPGGAWGLVQYLWTTEPNPPLYFVFMRCWLDLFGSSAFALRLPSAIAGAGLAPVLMWTAWEARKDVRIAVTAGILTAINPFLFYYSQEGRVYLIQTLIIGVNLALMTRLWNQREQAVEKWLPAAIAASAALAIFSHYYSIFLLVLDLSIFGLLFLICISLEGWPNACQKFLHPAWSAPILSLAALLFYALMAGSIAASRPGWAMQLPEWRPVFILLQLRAIFYGPHWAVVPAWALAIPLAAWIALLINFRWHERPAATIPALWGVFCLLALPHLVSIFHPILLGGQRYTVIAMPALILLTCIALMHPRIRWLQIVLLAALLLAPAPYYYSYFSHRQKRTWDTAAEICQQQLAEDNGEIWALSPFEIPLSYYLGANREKLHLMRSYEEHPAPAASSDMIILVAAKVKTAQSAIPPSCFHQEGSAILLETHQPGNEIALMIFRRDTASVSEHQE